MSGFAIAVDDARVLAALRRLSAALHDPAPVNRAIAALGESTTRQRFRSETGPDGQKWKPSLRAQIAGGRTLTERGHLSGSLSSHFGADFAEWGVNRIYAAIHQFGGKIEKGEQSRLVRHRIDAKGNLLRSDALGGKGLVFAKDSHKRVRARWFYQKAHSITMPARPYLGVSAGDAADIVALIERRLQGAIGAA